jgi:hypothetical protein
MDVNTDTASSVRTGPPRLSVAAAFALLALASPSRTLLAQPPSALVGPGTRIRITISSALTARDVSAMVGADRSVSHVRTAERTIIVQAPQAPPLVLPAPGATFVGIVLAVDNQAVSIKAEGVSSALTVPRAAIARLERADGRRSRVRYAALGSLIGLSGGALAGLASASSCGPTELLCSPALGAFAGGIVGAGTGAVIGAIMPPAERWTAVDATISLTSSPPSEPSVPSKPQKPSRVTVTFQTGQPSSGPAHDVEEAMRVSGFADPSPAFFGPAIDHPHSRTGFGQIGIPFTFELDYVWTPSWSVGFVQSHTPMGETLGYRSRGAQYLDVQYQVTTTGVVVLKHHEFFRVGGGLALHRAQVRQDPGAQPDPALRDESWASRSRVGVIALAGIRLPKETRVFLDLSLQYRLLPQAPIGPITPPAFGTPPATLPAFDAQFSHWYVAVGPGVRF